MAPAALLARVGLPQTDSTSTGLLVAASHLGVADVGSGNLHAARSMPLLLLLMIVWDALMPATPSMLFSGLRIGIILLAPSLTNTNQWMLVPVFTQVGVFQTDRLAYHSRLQTGILIFLVANLGYHQSSASPNFQSFFTRTFDSMP